MRVLLLTQYFPPETGAPQNRLHSLAKHLSKFGAEVSVLTAMPNYPKMEIFDGYKNQLYTKESDGNIQIHRAWIYIQKSKKIIPRLLNYFSFVITSFITGLIKIRKTDLIICESPPLFLGITALLLKFFKGCKLVFNVSDLWPESAEKLGLVNNRFFLNLSYKLEKLIYKKSDLVSGQTMGIISNIKNRFPHVPTYLFRNGIDFEQFDTDGIREIFRSKNGIDETDFVVTYAGIIGHAQGLEVIIHAAKKLEKFPKIKFMIVGDGPEKEKLVLLSKELKNQNIVFENSVPRNEMKNVIAACDVYVTPLRKNDLFLGAIPSKIFEPLYYRKPVIIGVDGEAFEVFVKEGKCALHFEPENSDQLAERIIQIFKNKNLAAKLGENGYEFIKLKFDRSKLAATYWEQLCLIK